MILAWASLAVSTLPLAQENTSLVLPQSDIRLLANRVLKKAGNADCKSGSCRLLVTNFALPSGDTSQLGSLLADAFSRELAMQQGGIQIIERSRLQTYLLRERIPSRLLSDDRAVRWLARQVGATTVLRGMTEDWGDTIRVRVTLLSAVREREARMEEFTFPSSSDLKAALAPAEAFPKEPPPVDPAIPLVSKAGAGGVGSPPRCQYCPQPSYTDPARQAKLQGTLMLQVVVTADGRASTAGVVRGLPYGLNEQAINAVKGWHLQPATRGNEPLTCSVVIEMTFHLY
jgi:TonB family protein